VDPSFYTTEVPLSAQEKVGNTVAQSSDRRSADERWRCCHRWQPRQSDRRQGGRGSRARRCCGSASERLTRRDYGGGATAAAGLEGLLGLGGMAPGLLRSGIADAGYGYAAGGPTGAVAGAVGGAAGNRLTKGLGATIKGVTNPTVGYVAKEVPLTIGQASASPAGRAGSSRAEDRLSGIPVVGDAINARRLEGLQKMNAKAFDRALEPIGGKSAASSARKPSPTRRIRFQALSSKALAGKSAGLDTGSSSMPKAKMGTRASCRIASAARSTTSIDDVINNYFDDSGQISGENMQALLQELGGIKRGYQGDPLGHRIGKVVDQFTDSVENLFRRQAPDVMPQYDAAKTAFKRVSTLEDAVNRARTPAACSLPLSSAWSTAPTRSSSAARAPRRPARGEFHDFQRNMQEVLPNKVPDSGTAGGC
jgi:hypothetical protein